MTEAEDIINEKLRKGEGTITYEEAVGLRGKKLEPETPQKKRKRNLLARALIRMRRGLREGWGGEETYLYESPTERRKRVEEEEE